MNRFVWYHSRPWEWLGWSEGPSYNPGPCKPTPWIRQPYGNYPGYSRIRNPSSGEIRDVRNDLVMVKIR